MKNNYLNDKHWKFIICLLLIAATILLYWRTANYDFISYDDPFYITENRHVQNGLTIDGIIWAFTNKETGYLHPLTWLSYMLDYELYGLNPMGYHWTNLQFHIANTVLLFLVLNFMTSALWRSAFVAALFALHPLHVESVAWISERKDVLSTFFFILSIWAYVRYVRFGLKKNYFIILIFFVLGLMSKPMLVTLPFVFLLLDYWPLERLLLPDFIKPKKSSTQDSLKLPFFRLVSEKIPLFILSASVCFATVFLQQTTIKNVILSESVSLKLRIYNAVVTYVIYIGKMFWPHNMAVFYPYSKTFHIGMVFACGFFLAGVSFLIIIVSQKFPYLVTGWFWYLGILFPVIGLIPVSFYSMADRYTYISLIGLFVIVSWGTKDIARGLRLKKPILSVSASIILILIMAGTWFQVGYWKNSETVFSHALNVTKNNWLAHNGIGMAMAGHGELDKAILNYKAALAIRPDYIQALNNSGIAFFGLGKYDDAISNFKKVLTIDPYNIKANYNLGKALSVSNDIEGAILYYSKALKFNPEFVKAHGNLAILLSSQGKIDEALYHAAKAVRIDPENPDYRINLADILIKKGENNKAVMQISRGLGLINFNNSHSINPYYAKFFNELGKALVKAGRPKKAEIFFYRATQIDPEYSEACKNLIKLKK